jgi:hypothetical protein
MLTVNDVSPQFGIKKVYNSPTLDSDAFKPPVPLLSYLGMYYVGPGTDPDLK